MPRACAARRPNKRKCAGRKKFENLRKSDAKRRIIIVSNSATQTEAAAAKACDISVKPFSFSQTETELEAITAAGRNFLSETFGAGAVSIRIPVSQLPAFAAFAAGKAGVTVG
jgi:hypothetical protein